MRPHGRRMPLAEIRLDGSIEWRKKPAPISYCPELSRFSLFLSFSLPTRCFPSSIPDLCNSRVSVRRTEHFSCRIWHVQANSPIKGVTQEYPLSKTTTAPRENQTRASIKCGRSLPFASSRPSFRSVFVSQTRCLLRD